MNPKSLVVVALAGTALVSALLAPPHSNGQAAAAEDPVVTALLNELTAQQAELVDNQAKIDGKLATISENVRLARIYAGRSGGKTP